MFVERFFRESGITPNWLYVLSNGDTEIVGNTLINACVMDGVTVINSCSVGDEKFCMGAIKRIIKIANPINNVIISSSVETISEHMIRRYGFTYCRDTQTYKKGE